VSRPASFQYLFSYRISLAVSRRNAYRIAAFGAALAYSLKIRERASVRRNLSVILRLPPGSSEIRRACRRLYANFGRSCVDSLYDTKGAAANARSNTVENAQILKEAVGAGKGVVLMTAHLGNWEIGAMSIARLGLPITVVAHLHEDPRIQAIFQKRRESHGIRAVSNRDNPRVLLRVLKEGGILGILGDRLYGVAGMQAKFFGRRTRIPKGPASLSLISGAPVVAAVSMPAEDRSGYRIVLGNPVHPPSKGNPTERERYMKRVTAELENIIRPYPEFWFAFEDIF